MKATCRCHNIKFVIYISFKGRQFLFALSCSLQNAIVYLSFFCDVIMHHQIFKLCYN